MKKAFTLIELLIVIAIIGILAVGVLVGINPLEQTRKATDTSMIDISTEFKNAIDRYYAGHNNMPWCLNTSPPGTCTLNVAGGCTDQAGFTTNTGLLLDSGGCILTAVTTMIGVGEIKSTFLGSAGSNAHVIHVWSDANYATYIGVGFQPKSNTYQTNTNTNVAPGTGCVYLGAVLACGAVCTGGVGHACTADQNTCYYCIK